MDKPKIGRIHICVPNYRGVIEALHHESMIQLAHALGVRKRSFNFINPSHTIASLARQICVNTALADPQMSHVLFIDDDMVFGPEQFAALEKAFFEQGLDFLGALAFSNSIPTKPCVFGLNPDYPEWGDTQWWHLCTDYPKAEVVEVYATGFGMCMISRRMLDGMKEYRKHGQLFQFEHPLCPNEDIAFCLNAHKAGFKLYVDTGVSIGHISKDRAVIGEDVYEAQEDALEYTGNLEPRVLSGAGVAERKPE